MRVNTGVSGITGAAMAAAVLVFGAGSASAQATAAAKDDSTGLFCVYDTLVASDDYKVVAEVFLSDETPEEFIGRAAVLQQAAVNACTEKHMLTEGQAASMADMGLYGSAMDYLSDKLVAAGVSKKAVTRMFGVYDKLEEEDVDRFFEDDWRSDVSFSGKLKDDVVAAGLPDKDTTIDISFAIFEISAMADQAIFTFLVDDL